MRQHIAMTAIIFEALEHWTVSYQVHNNNFWSLLSYSSGNCSSCWEIDVFESATGFLMQGMAKHKITLHPLSKYLTINTGRLTDGQVSWLVPPWVLFNCDRLDVICLFSLQSITVSFDFWVWSHACLASASHSSSAFSQ